MRFIFSILIFSISPILLAQNNLLDTSSWTVGQGSVAGFNGNHSTSDENQRIIGVDPHGNNSVLWKAVPDGGNNLDGGWGTPYINIDSSKSYRFTLWLKKENTQVGRTYFGCYGSDGNSSQSFQKISTSGTSSFFLNGWLPQIGQWYLLVGFIHASNYSGTTDIGGIYDTSGNKVSSLTDLKFINSHQLLSFFNYHNWASDNSSRQYSFAPTIYEVNGQEPTVTSLINGNSNSIDTVAPSVPSNLQYSNITQTSVVISWSASTDNVGVTAYEVLRNNSVVGTTSGSTSYTDTGLTVNTNYSYAVRAKDAAGNTSSSSTTVNLTTSSIPDTQSPSIPSNLQYSNITQTSVVISWSASTDNVGVTAYEVLRNNLVVGTTSGSTSYTDTGLSANTNYSYAVRAKDAAGNTSSSSTTTNLTTTSTPDTQSPSIPTNLVASGKTTTGITLSWTASIDNVGVAFYEILQGNTVLATVSSNTSYTVTGLTANTTYSFSVRAKDAAGNTSANSTALSVATLSSGGGGTTTTSLWNQTGDNIHYSDGNVGIGTTSIPNDYKLAVNGKIITEELKVQLQSAWPDYVFQKDYKLPSIEEVAKHIKDKGHLPNIPSAKEVKENGIEVGEMNRLLLEKIEELTLYILKQEEKINRLKKLEVRISKLEKK